MSDCMTFPDTVEEFMEQYKIVDTDGIYMSKGAELVPIFRMRQWFEHLPSAQPDQRWIPVTERLPKKNVWVLVTFMMANGEVDIDIMRINRWDGGWDTHTFDMAYRETVIAWMPLPKPYGGEQE